MLKEIPIKDISIIENHRENIEKTDLHELMTSIKQHGLKQPIGVFQPSPKAKKDRKIKGKYVLLYGNRRLVACHKLGYKTISAMLEPPPTDEQHLIINLTENMQRKDPTLLEYARVIMRLADEMNMDYNQISARLGINKEKIYTIMKIYKSLPEKLRERVIFAKPGKRDFKAGMGVSSKVANALVGLKKKHNISDTTIEKIFDHCEKNGSSMEDLDNVSRIVDQGYEVDEALDQIHEYGTFTICFSASNREVNAKLVEHQVLNKRLLFIKILYGELPPLTKPPFIETGTRDTVRKNAEELEQARIANIDTMRLYLSTQERIGNLNKTQEKAISTSRKVKTKDLNEGQIIQIERMYKDLNTSAK